MYRKIILKYNPKEKKIREFQYIVQNDIFIYTMKSQGENSTLVLIPHFQKVYL